RGGIIVTQSSVILFPADGALWTHLGLQPARIRSAISVGREGYRISRLRAGTYLAVATDLSQSSAWHDPRFLEAAAAVATPVTLSWGSAILSDLTLRSVTVK